MPIDTSIGEVSVGIVGDYSQLQSDFESARGAAATAGQSIAAAFDQSAAQTDALAQSANNAALAFDVLGTAALTSEHATAGVGEAAEHAATGTQHFGDAAHETSEHVQEAAEKTADLLKELLAFAGITVSIEALKELATEALHVFAETEKAEISLGFLMGSAEKAGEAIEHLREVAQELAVPFQDLIHAEQRMTAFGFAAEQVQAAIRAAADAAAASGNSFDAAAGAIERMALGGMAGARQLVQLGLSATDLASVMGVSLGKVTDEFKRLTTESRVDVLIEALEKFKGAGEAAANSTQGNLDRMKNAWHFAMDDIGKAIAPLFNTIITGVTDALFYFSVGITGLISEAKQLVEVLKSVAAATTGDFAAAGAHLAAADVLRQEELKTLGAMIAKHDDLKKSTEETARQVVLHYNDMGDAVEDHFKRLVKAFGESGPANARLQEDLRATKAEFAETGKYLAWYYANAEALNEALRNLGVTSQPLIDTTGDLTKQFDGAQKAIGKLVDVVAVAQSQLANDPFGQLADSAAYFKIQTVGSLEEVARVSAEKFDQMLKTGLATERELAIAALETAKAEIDADYAAGAISRERWQHEREMIDADLNAVTIHDQKVKQSRYDLSTELVRMSHQMFDSLERDLAKDIVEWKGFADTITNIGKKLAEDFLEIMLKGLFKPLEDKFAELAGKIGGWLGGIFGAGSSGAGVLGTSVGAGGGAAASGAGSAGGIGGAASGIGGGLAGTVTAVGSAVSAITGVLSFISGMHQETSLNAIEHNTRFSMMYLGERADGGILGVLFKLDEHLQFGNLTKAVEDFRNKWYDWSGRNSSGGSGISFTNCTFTGITNDTIDAMADAIIRKARASGWRG